MLSGLYVVSPLVTHLKQTLPLQVMMPLYDYGGSVANKLANCTVMRISSIQSRVYQPESLSVLARIERSGYGKGISASKPSRIPLYLCGASPLAHKMEISLVEPATEKCAYLAEQ